jgi:uncharacterized phage protein (TIGR02220 family)
VNDKILLPNSFQTPNALVDKAMQIVSGSAFKLLIAITRLTLGWNHDGTVQISLDGLRKRTALSRQGTLDGLKELKKLELIILKKGPRNSRTPNEYALNLDLTTGELVKNIDRSKLLTGATSPQIRPVLVQKSDSLKPILNPKEKEPAESAKQIPGSLSTKGERKRQRAAAIPPELQPVISRVVARINELAGTQYRDDKPDALRNLIARLNEGRTEAECLTVVEGRHAWIGDEKMSEYFRPSTLFAAAHFEDYLQAAHRANGNGHTKDNSEWRKKTFING